MISSALALAIVGLPALFLPQEILNNIDGIPNGFIVSGIQIMGALYLGFALMNWMAKSVLIGGIYSRPLSMGNFFHFVVGAITLLKISFSQPHLKYIWIPCIVYSFFAFCFGVVSFTSPSNNN